VRETGDNVQKKLQAAIESKQFPDVSQVDSGRFTQFYPSKVFVDVSDLYQDFAKTWTGFYPVAEKTVTQDGKQWMLPYSIDSSLCLHWKDMLDAAGVKSIATWDEFFAGCKKASNPPEVYPVGYQLSKCSDAEGTWSLMMYGFGASLVKEDSKTLNIKTPEMKSFLTYFKKQLDDGMFPPGATGWDNSSDNVALQDRKVVADQDPASPIVWLKNNRPDWLPNLGAASTPGGPKGRFNSAYVRDGFAVMATGDEKRINLSKDLMRQLYSKEVYRQWIGLAFPSPAVKGMEDHEVWKNPLRAGYLEAAKTGILAGYPGVPTPAQAELGTRMPVATMIVRIAVDNWTAEQAMDEADQVARDVYGKYYKT
jgi:ABC-type glycerol-3-phosphate transport system substrate-binding protein